MRFSNRPLLPLAISAFLASGVCCARATPAPKADVQPTIVAACLPAKADDPHPDFDGNVLTEVCHGLYVEPSVPWAQRELAKRWYGEASTEVERLFRSDAEAPMAIVCVTESCMRSFAGPTLRSRAMMQPWPTVVIHGLDRSTKGTLVHEMVHIAIARKSEANHRGLPAWFDEGVATYVGDNVACNAEMRPAIDDVRRLRAGHAWEAFTDRPNKLEATYCQARAEVVAWLGGRKRSAIVDAIDAVLLQGRPFDEVYGRSLDTPNPQPGRLDASFTFDEGDVVDASGRGHVATLRGAERTTGRHGSGVSVDGAGSVRVDGLEAFGLPDQPFSIALWVKPRANAHVLVHSSVNESGGNGFCLPILGHDSRGRLVAQVSFATDPKALLVATGRELALGQWNHVAMTWRAVEGVRLYIDGSLVASAAPKVADERHRDAPAVPMYLFFGGDNGGRCWTGALEAGTYRGTFDDVHVYDHVLTTDEIARDMNL